MSTGQHTGYEGVTDSELRYLIWHRIHTVEEYERLSREATNRARQAIERVTKDLKAVTIYSTHSSQLADAIDWLAAGRVAALRGADRRRTDLEVAAIKAMRRG